MTLQNAYWIALGALVFVTTFRGSLAMFRTVMSMFAVGLLSLFLAGRMDWVGEEYALSMMAADAVAAAIVLIHPAGRAQSVIGLTFLLQIGVYFARLLHGPAFDVTAYWWLLSILAMLQLFVAGGWIASEHIAWRPAFHRRRKAADSAYREGMGG